MCEHQGGRSLYVHRTCWLFLCQSCVLLQALIISRTNERLRKVALSRTACNMTETLGKKNKHAQTPWAWPETGHHHLSRHQKRAVNWCENTHTDPCYGYSMKLALVNKIHWFKGRRERKLFPFFTLALAHCNKTIAAIKYCQIENWKASWNTTGFSFWRVETL